MQNQVTHAHLLFDLPKKCIQLMESQLPVSMLFQLQISTFFLQITMNHRNPRTRYSLLILSNQQDPCQLVTISTSKDFERRAPYPSINLDYRHKPNLQKPMNNEDGACPIATVVNGVTSVNPNPKTAPKYSESTGNLINKLQETINVYNKEKCSLSTKHRIILIGDSNIKGYVCAFTE